MQPHDLIVPAGFYPGKRQGDLDRYQRYRHRADLLHPGVARYYRKIGLIK